MENTFTSIEDVAPRLFPLLGLFIGPRRCLLLAGALLPQLASFAVLQGTLCHRACAMPRWFNFLVRNKWESKGDIRHLARLPVLLLSSLKVSTAALLTCTKSTRVAGLPSSVYDRRARRQQAPSECH